MTAPPAPYAIDVDRLNKHFGDKHVVKDVSLRVARGEIFGFLGPNGSGKTTSIRMMCGLLTPDSGSGTCLGYDIVRDSAQIKRRVGYMTQRFSYWEDLSIRENLDFVARVYGCPTARRPSRAHSTPASRAARTSSRVRCRAAGSSASRWPPACCTARYCCSTNRRPASIRPRAATSGKNCTGWPRKGSRCSSARTTWTRPSAATSWRTSHTASCSRRARPRRSSRRETVTRAITGAHLSELSARLRDAGRRPDGRVRLGAARERPRSRPARRDARAGRGTSRRPASGRTDRHRAEDVFIYMMGRASGPPGGASS